MFRHIFDYGVNIAQLSQTKLTPQLVPKIGAEDRVSNVDNPFFRSCALLPETSDHQEIVIDLALSENITQSNWSASFGRLD
jgi:hypothetical protein